MEADMQTQEQLSQQLQQQLQVQQQQQQQSQQQQQQQIATVPAPLHVGVKVERPAAFNGRMDGDSVRAFLFSCERYFTLVQLTNPQQQAAFMSMLLVEHAALWLQNQGYDWSTVDYATLKHDLQAYFIPPDAEYHARTQLAACRQTGNIHGYIAAFTKLALRISDLSEAEKLDKFLRGLKPEVFQHVIMHAPANFATATALAARTASRLGYAVDQQRAFGGKVDSSKTTGAGSGGGVSGPVPMVLGTQRGFGRQMSRAVGRGRARGYSTQYRAEPPPGRADGGRARTGRGARGRGGRMPQRGMGTRFEGECFHCGKYGHRSRDCWSRAALNAAEGEPAAEQSAERTTTE